MTLVCPGVWCATQFFEEERLRSYIAANQGGLMTAIDIPRMIRETVQSPDFDATLTKVCLSVSLSLCLCLSVSLLLCLSALLTPIWWHSDQGVDRCLDQARRSHAHDDCSDGELTNAMRSEILSQIAPDLG